MIAPAHFYRRVLGDRLAGLGDLDLTGKNQACQHEGLGPSAAFDQTTRDQQLIDADLPGRLGRARLCGKAWRFG
jgi:hypothetical protein